MQVQNIIPDQPVALFVKNIMVFENKDDVETAIPFFADGYPGLMFHQTEKGLTIQPYGKKMPIMFLYGQTIKPIAIEVDGPFKIVIFQFYPFVLRAFWGINPQDINDSCYDLDDKKKISELVKEILSSPTIQEKIAIISRLLIGYFEQKGSKLDFSIRGVIQCIIDKKGAVSIHEIAKKENLHIRTLERRFLKETGISAKQFAKIVQFQTSLTQLTTHDFGNINEIVYANGFSDQSHFIRVFKAFTGLTPNTFSKQ
ncbi:helix-turn-helix domain-containing protein [Sphingobacterium sp.]|uniref:helix-turn-helix domain-containing protein n=1 Tax=Sphingobacterium sp. TaxID=341027 RepID=UPI0031D59E6E